MKDGTETAEPAGFCRQDVFEDYRQWCLQLCPDVQPCRDRQLLKKATQYLQRQPDLREIFTVFPFLQAVTQGSGEPNPDRRRQLACFIRASEMLETICVNLVLQPWKREIKTIKTFTGPFVYHLLPVLSSATIQSVLASIGYVPHDDASQREFRLSPDASSDRAMLVGFELLLARLECCRLLDVLVKNQLTPHEWLELLQRGERPVKPMRAPEKKTRPGPKDTQEKTKKELVKTEGPSCLERRLAFNAKPRQPHHISVDKSIMEMQKTYPDLAIRGRPLVPDQPHKAAAAMACSKVLSDAELPGKNCVRQSKAPANLCRDEDTEADEVFAGCNDRSSGRTAALCPCSSDSDGGGVDEELSGPQAISLHMTLRATTEAELGLKSGKPQSRSGPASETQQQSDRRNEGAVSLGSLDEAKALKELVKRMETASVQGNKGQGKGREDDERRQEDMSIDKRQKERKISSERSSRGKSQDGGDGVCADDGEGN
ncbi:spermatogenesis-associated protein 2 [Melanotaenia boesemani]|uniref:spermatogenesis-associated protein 2 n=1 Tax=Melanotaenia boesemani TaxID=1250792 RepID=UPI001C042E7E|nr:spermatogenesis-associated protein 2 [Melanotaenia boesemani]XP_041866078.1 spermatogenesis-associated protein 2 [Melanotaenia boesemani]